MSESASRAVRVVAAEHHPNEIGGILLGVYVAGTRPWVTAAPMIRPEEAGATFYVLPEGARPAAVDRARAGDARLGYLGDWHSHPLNAPYSQKDLTTIRRVAADTEAASPNPLLLIAKRVGAGYVLDVRQFSRRRLREQRVIAAGDLPALSYPPSSKLGSVG